ncbi:MAG: uncharacterized protein A8A55_0107 [Amphiamblys sp. WSBS2006]|nr:MAG: uncharacterized protein A8A55_0107 [Amphiamblys sp. WSBS2006]
MIGQRTKIALFWGLAISLPSFFPKEEQCVLSISFVVFMFYLALGLCRLFFGIGTGYFEVPVLFFTTVGLYSAVPDSAVGLYELFILSSTPFFVIGEGLSLYGIACCVGDWAVSSVEEMGVPLKAAILVACFCASVWSALVFAGVYATVSLTVLEGLLLAACLTLVVFLHWVTLVYEEGSIVEVSLLSGIVSYSIKAIFAEKEPPTLFIVPVCFFGGYRDVISSFVPFQVLRTLFLRVGLFYVAGAFGDSRGYGFKRWVESFSRHFGVCVFTMLYTQLWLEFYGRCRLSVFSGGVWRWVGCFLLLGLYWRRLLGFRR